MNLTTTEARFDSRLGQRYFFPRSRSCPTEYVPETLPQRYRDGLMLIILSKLVSTLRMCGAINSFPHTPSWGATLLIHREDVTCDILYLFINLFIHK
jgi:hypothetical protein